LTNRPRCRHTWMVSGIQQLAPVCTPPNTYFFGPTRVHIPNDILIGSAIFVQLRAQCLGNARACPFPYKLPIGIGQSGPRLIHCTLGPSEPITQTASQSVHPFPQLTAECPYTLQWATPSPLNIASSHGGSEPTDTAMCLNNNEDNDNVNYCGY